MTQPLVIPTVATANQTFTVILDGQTCALRIYQKRIGLFLDLTVDGVQLRNSILCLNGVKLVREPYLGFSGELGFVDINRENDAPDYTGLGTRYLLLYYPP